MSKNGEKWKCQLKYNIVHSFLYNDELHAAYHHDLLVKEFKLENFSILNNVECPLDFIRKFKIPKTFILFSPKGGNGRWPNFGFSL